MQDHKMAAANDQENNLNQLPNNGQNFSARSTDQSSLDYVKGALFHLETFTGKTLTEDETELWKGRLLKYPKSKLSKLSEYTGGLNNDVFKFLDDLRDGHTGALNGLKQLPEPKTDIARDVLAYVAKITSDDYARTEAGDNLEREFMAAMRAKYHRGNWVCGRRANR